jgi:hypothetical protein
MTKPILEVFDGIHVVRDDLFPGGTKARFIPELFSDADELVYASPACGGAQFALATVARYLGKRVTIFVAKRAVIHPRTYQAARLGANIQQVVPGYLTVVRARAREYANQAPRAKLLSFGLEVPLASKLIATAARQLKISPDEIWCAAGSGVLARGLFLAWPEARRHVVEIGRTLKPADVPGAKIWPYPLAFENPCKTQPPFPSDRHYDAKAWEVCRANHGSGLCVFWNVTGCVS